MFFMTEGARGWDPSSTNVMVTFVWPVELEKTAVAASKCQASGDAPEVDVAVVVVEVVVLEVKVVVVLVVLVDVVDVVDVEVVVVEGVPEMLRVEVVEVNVEVVVVDVVVDVVVVDEECELPLEVKELVPEELEVKPVWLGCIVDPARAGRYR